MATHDCTTDESEDLNSESLDLNSESPSTLEEIIEKERTQLMIADQVLGCASVAIENDRSADRHDFYYPDVIAVGRTMIDETINRLDSVYLRAFYKQLESARRDLSQIEAAARSGMTIATVGHASPLLTINTGVAECGDISDGISLAHHGGVSAEGWLVDTEGWWVMSFADLEAIYHSAVAKRAAKHGGAIPEASSEQESAADVELLLEADSPADVEPSLEAVSPADVEQSLEADSAADREPAHEGIATAVKLLGQAQDDLAEVDSYIFVCLEALAPKVGYGGDEAREPIAWVLHQAYEKLHLDAERNVREALKALGQDGGE